MTFEEIASHDKKRRAMRSQEIVDRINRNMAKVEQTIAYYRASFTLLQGLLNDNRYVVNCLKNPNPYFNILSGQHYAESTIRQLLEQIALDRAEIEIRVAQDLSAQGSDEPRGGQRTREISVADGQRAIDRRRDSRRLRTSNPRGTGWGSMLR
jgi:hypothetical protein